MSPDRPIGFRTAEEKPPPLSRWHRWTRPAPPVSLVEMSQFQPAAHLAGLVDDLDYDWFNGRAA